MNDSDMVYLKAKKSKIIFKNPKRDVIKLFVLVQSNSWSIIRWKYKNAQLSCSGWCLEPSVSMKMII